MLADGARTRRQPERGRPSAECTNEAHERLPHPQSHINALQVHAVLNILIVLIVLE